MTLESEKDPVSSFVSCGEAYIANPGVMAGLALDDALVVLKRHLMTELGEHTLIDQLNVLGKSLRNQDTVAITEGVRSIAAGLKEL